MKIVQFMFFGFFLLSASRDIIRDLPYNIYQIEDMEQYETKYLPEGNKFYIRFPSNLNQDVNFYLTIPKNTTLFPIYSSDFSNYPKDDEIIKSDFENELQLKNREDAEYSIYSFDIKKTDSYKVLYFQNNEILNYLSFYAAPAVSNTSNVVIKTIEYDKRTTVRERQEGYYYIFRVDVNEDSNIKIEIKISTRYNPSFQVDVAYFDKFPNDDTVKNQDNFELNIDYEFKIEEGYEIRAYKTKNKNDDKYMAFQIVNDRDLRSIDIHVKYGGWATWIKVILYIVGGIVLLVIIFVAVILLIIYTECKYCKDCDCKCCDCTGCDCKCCDDCKCCESEGCQILLGCLLLPCLPCALGCSK